MNAPDLTGARWFKSTRSNNNGACVEAAILDATWFKSTRSTNNGACVEAAFLPTAMAVRDSKDPEGPALLFPARDWSTFVTAARFVASARRTHQTP